MSTRDMECVRRTLYRSLICTDTASCLFFMSFLAFIRSSLSFVNAATRSSRLNSQSHPSGVRPTFASPRLRIVAGQQRRHYRSLQKKRPLKMISVYNNERRTHEACFACPLTCRPLAVILHPATMVFTISRSEEADTH